MKSQSGSGVLRIHFSATTLLATIVAVSLTGPPISCAFPSGQRVPANSILPPSSEFELTSADSLILTATAAVAALFRSKGDIVWPGYDLSRRPVLIYLPDRWAILLNAPQNVEGFSTYPEDWPDLGVPALLHRGSFKRLLGQLEFDLEIDGIRTVAVAPTAGLGSGRRAAIGLGFMFVIHEAFHQYQHDTFKSIADDLPEEEYPILNSENTALASLEMHLLRDAIKTASRGDTTLTREYVAEFLAVRRQRWNRLPDSIPLFERPQEIMEGSAQYVQVQSVGLMGELCEEFGVVSTSLPGCDVFRDVTTELFLLSDFEDRIDGGVIDPIDMARNRVYPVGAAIGLLLDFFRIDWKSRVSDAASSPGLAEILENAFKADLTRSESLLVRAKQRYRYDVLRVACDRHAQSYEAEYKAGVDSLVNAPGFHISIETPVMNICRSRSCEGRRLVLGRPTRSFSKKCHVYTLKRLAKDDLVVEIRESAIVEEANPEGTTRRVDFVASDIQNIELDGQPLDPGVSETHSFKHLVISGSNFKVRYDGAGQLIVEERRIIVQLIPPPSSDGK